MEPGWKRVATPEIRFSFSDQYQRLGFFKAIKYWTKDRLNYWGHRLVYNYYQLDIGKGTIFYRRSLKWKPLEKAVKLTTGE